MPVARAASQTRIWAWWADDAGTIWSVARTIPIPRRPSRTRKRGPLRRIE